MADATTTSGNIYQNAGENVVAAIKEAEYDLSTRLHHNTDVLQNRIENNKDVIRSDVQRDKDYLSDKLTQEYIGGIQNSQAHADRLSDRQAADDFRSESRFTTQTLAATLAEQSLTAQANNIAATETLSNSLAFQSLTNQAANVAATSTLAGSLAAQNDIATSNQIANAQVLAANQAFQTLAQQNQNLANVTWLAQTAAVSKADAIAAAQVMASNLLARDIAAQAEATRALINHNYVIDVRDRLERKHDELVECRGDRRHDEREFRRYDREFSNLNQNALLSNFTSQVNAINSNLQNYHQAATQGTVNFGSMAGNAGRNTSTNNVV